MLSRRGFIAGLFAPAVIRTPGLLMPIKAIIPVERITLVEYISIDELSRMRAIVNMLSQANEIMDDIPWMAAKQVTYTR